MVKTTSILDATINYLIESKRFFPELFWWNPDVMALTLMLHSKFEFLLILFFDSFLLFLSFYYFCFFFLYIYIYFMCIFFCYQVYHNSLFREEISASATIRSCQEDACNRVRSKILCLVWWDGMFVSKNSVDFIHIRNKISLQWLLY